MSEQELCKVDALTINDFEGKEEEDVVGELAERDIEARIECMKAKIAHPEMFVSGFDVDDQGIEPPDDPDSPGEKLLTAAEEGSQVLAHELISINPDLVLYKDKDGYTALHRASYSDNSTMVRFLISKGSKVDEVTLDGWTPLHSACYWNSFKAARELVDNCANVNATTNGGQTPLHLASAQQCRESMIILLTSPAINVNIKNQLGETSLDLAKRAGRFHYLFDMSQDAINKL